MAGIPSVPTVPSWLPLWRFALVVGVGVSALVVVKVVGPDGAWSARLRERFVLGVPWGTLATAVFLVAVYLFLQGGADNLYSPLVVPFRAWSYRYPLGIVTAPFSHAGFGHLQSNLLGTITFGAVAEYAYGHFPRRRGSQAFSSLPANPYARIAGFLAAVAGVGLLTSVFGVGWIIGFSGVVFAFAGFALVRYPLTTVLVIFAGRVIDLVRAAFRNPTVTAEGTNRFVTPWWADVAIQGHYLGLLIGVVAGVVVTVRLDRRPRVGRVWFATIVFAVSESMWALYWFLGNGRYVLFRAPGTAAVFLLAALVVAALAASDRRLVARIDLRRRETALIILGALCLAVALAAVPVNLLTVADSSPPGEHVQVRDYRVAYAEDVSNEYVSLLNVSIGGLSTEVNTSGVIVISERRHIWYTAVTESRLAFSHRERVRLGGLGWERTVVVNRSGWSATGGGNAYRVSLRPRGRQPRVVYTSPPARAEPVLRGNNVSLNATERRFLIELARDNETTVRVRVPPPGENTTAAGITFNRTGNRVYALFNGTRVRIAKRNTGN
ncbi:rhomboid family intramembrane serine protease [Halobacteriales archaeon QS_1_68_17]|nr:MAG: rhomboid family intramembrane serine protease [Halobacteriales archaeon QS_1_68_17]